MAEESPEDGLRTLSKLKRAMERQQNRNRGTHRSDTVKCTSPLAAPVPDPTLLLTSKPERRRALEIRTDVPSVSLYGLLSTQQNEYASALKRIESLKKVALCSHPPTCQTEETGQRPGELAQMVPPGPQSVPSKLQHVGGSEDKGFAIGEQKGQAPETEGKKSAAELRECKEQVAKLCKEIRELKRQKARDESAHAVEIENIKHSHQEAVAQTKEEMERQLMEKDRENEAATADIRVGLAAVGSRPDENVDKLREQYEAVLSDMAMRHSEALTRAQVLAPLESLVGCNRAAETAALILGGRLGDRGRGNFARGGS